MEGVILFADDHIFTENSGERALFESLRVSHPVLGVQSLEHAKKSLLTMSSFQALILDYDFNSATDKEALDVSEELGVGIKISKGAIKENETLDFLTKNDFYTLVYIFSNVDVKAIFPEQLSEKYAGRIQFVQKGDLTDAKRVGEKILVDITEWQKANAKLSVPIMWSSSINSSLQQIFSELSSADLNWVINLYETASTDGVNPEIEVISLLQNLLTEKLITKADLLSAIKVAATDRDSGAVLADEKSIGKLFQRIYYTDLTPFDLTSVPIMTGDIFLLDPTEKIYGIIISPECDCQDICSTDLHFEFLTFQESKFNHSVFNEFFGQKNNKVKVDNTKVISTIHEVIKEKFIKFNPSLPTLFKKNRVAVKDENGESTGAKEEVYDAITEDVLIKPFLNQFEALINKHVDPALRKQINDQINEQNSLLLNELFLQAYNQTEKRIHLVPSFNFQSEYPNKTAVIDFRTGKAFKRFSELNKEGVFRVCKLNHPFISELRQRYNAYYGRIGVPKIPTILRNFNIKTLQP